MPQTLADKHQQRQTMLSEQRASADQHRTSLEEGLPISSTDRFLKVSLAYINTVGLTMFKSEMHALDQAFHKTLITSSNGYAGIKRWK